MAIPLFIGHRANCTELRLEESITVDNLKNRLTIVTGMGPADMALELQTARATYPLDIPEKRLQDYNIAPYDTIHVLCVRGSSGTMFGAFEVDPSVPKYEMSQDEYLKRPDNVVTWLSQVRSNVAIEKREPASSEEPEEFEPLSVGDRVFVVTKGLRNAGTVSYTGQVSFPINGKEASSSSGDEWVGVAYDDPAGKHDGSVGGKRYFQCKAGHGSFVRRRLIHEMSRSDDFDGNSQ